MALFPKRQAVLLSAAAATTARSSMTISAGAAGRGLAVGGAMMIMSMSSSVVASRIHNAGISGVNNGGAFFVSTMPRHRRRPASAAASPTRRSSSRAGASQLPFQSLTTRYFSSSDNDDGASSSSEKLTTSNKTGDRNGLIRDEIIADDGHPLRIYSRTARSSDRSTANDNDKTLIAKGARSILLLHGRTWSSQPVFDLRTSDDDAKRQSTLQSLADLGFHAYALDLRGFGETPRGYNGDGNNGCQGYTTPRRCVADVKCAIDWITNKHHHEEEVLVDDPATVNSTSIPGLEDPSVVNTRPALLGWSQGALVAQMYAQHHPSTLSDLILFGSIYDPKVIYSRKPLYDPSGRLISGGPNVVKPAPPEVRNTDIDSLEDFTLPGTICDEAALTFSSLALAVDPIKAAWDELHEFNILNPALVHVPTLVMMGAQDPYLSWSAQRELFERLGTEDKAMCVLPGCDHAAHILKARKMFVRGVVGFLLRKDEF
mmetsp:Transcript_7768/g.12472  ORF Transcript_7768/g.12472 Transcript_7768/m.12472 type:complete len:487 (-) Transcript_7768:253-1713(-)